MPARKRPGPAESAAATRILLDGLAGGRDLPDIAAELAAWHPRYDTFPDEVFLRIAADALAWCGASRADPVPLEGIRVRFLAGCSFRGRGKSKLQYAILAAAAISGGAEPDLLDEVAWWQSDDLWQYAMYAAAAFIRLAAGRAAVPVSQVCRELGNRPGQPARQRHRAGVRWRGPGCRSAWTWSRGTASTCGRGRDGSSRAARSHAFSDLADAIDDAFARWDRSHIQQFTLADGTRLCDPDPDRQPGDQIEEDYGRAFFALRSIS